MTGRPPADREHLKWLIKRGFIGVGTSELDETQKVLYCEAIEIAIPKSIKTVSEAIDYCIKEGVGGSNDQI